MRNLLASGAVQLVQLPENTVFGALKAQGLVDTETSLRCVEAKREPPCRLPKWLQPCFCERDRLWATLWERDICNWNVIAGTGTGTAWSAEHTGPLDV